MLRTTMGIFIRLVMVVSLLLLGSCGQEATSPSTPRTFLFEISASPKCPMGGTPNLYVRQFRFKMVLEQSGSTYVLRLPKGPAYSGPNSGTLKVEFQSLELWSADTLRRRALSPEALTTLGSGPLTRRPAAPYSLARAVSERHLRLGSLVGTSISVCIGRPPVGNVPPTITDGGWPLSETRPAEDAA